MVQCLGKCAVCHKHVAFISYYVQINFTLEFLNNCFTGQLLSLPL